MRRALIVLAVSGLAWAAPATAGAAVRLAAPGATGGEPCNPAPCSLATAVSGAPAGSEVIVAGGAYDLGAGTLAAAAAITVHGDDAAPAPVVTSTAAGIMLSVPAGSTLRNLDLRQGGSGAGTTTLVAPGAVVDRVAIANTSTGTNPRGLSLGSGSVVRESSVHVTGAAGIGVTGVQDDNLFHETLIHDTVEADGAGATAVFASAHCNPDPMFPGQCLLGGSGAMQMVLVDTIAQGGLGGHDAFADTAQAETATITTSFSSVHNVGGIVTQANALTGFPDLLDALSGDFHELPGSASLDAGTVAAGDDTVDLAGLPRTSGAATDIGAFEAPLALVASSSVAAGADPTTAIVTAAVDPLGQATVVHVELGSDTSYGTTTAEQKLGAGTAATLTFALGSLPIGTYHLRVVATNVFGTSRGPDLTFVSTAAAGPPGGGGPNPPPPPPTSPVLKAFSISPSRLRAGATGHFSITLDQAARVKISIVRRTTGIVVSGHCVAPSRRHRRGRSCKRTTSAGSLTSSRPAGASKVTFSGRVGSKKLPTGNYTATAVATGPTGLRSKSRSATFTILKA